MIGKINIVIDDKTIGISVDVDQAGIIDKICLLDSLMSSLSIKDSERQLICDMLKAKEPIKPTAKTDLSELQDFVEELSKILKEITE